MATRVLGYLIATLDDRDDAAEVFSVLSEDLWRGIAAFGWRSSFRTWMYTLAPADSGSARPSRTTHVTQRRIKLM